MNNFGKRPIFTPQTEMARMFDYLAALPNSALIAEKFSDTQGKVLQGKELEIAVSKVQLQHQFNRSPG
jgi:hypothetical protein